MKINNSTINYISNNSQNNQSKYNKNVSFGSLETAATNPIQNIVAEVSKGIPNKTNNLLERLLIHATNNSFIHKVITAVKNSNKGITNLLFLDSVILSSFYMINTAKNKNIKKEQKMPLIVNQGLVFAISAFCTFKVEKLLKDKVDTFRDAFKKISLAKYAGKSAQEIKKATKAIDRTATGINNIKTIVIFGMIYRFIAPVLMTPLANKVSEKIQHNKKEAGKMQSIKA